MAVNVYCLRSNKLVRENVHVTRAALSPLSRHSATVWRYAYMRWERDRQDRQDSPWPVEGTETLEGRTGQDRVECRGYSAECRVQGRDRIPQVPTSQSEVQNYKPYLHTPPTTT